MKPLQRVGIIIGCIIGGTGFIIFLGSLPNWFLKFSQETSAVLVLASVESIAIIVGLYPFFSEQEEVLSRKPLLSIEYDPRNSDVHTPESGIMGQYGQNYEYINKFLRVLVKNSGKSVAEDCKATLKIIESKAIISPSKEHKKLVWEDGEEKKDISVNGNEILNVAVSNSRLQNNDANPNKIFSLIATKRVIQYSSNAIAIIHAPDALTEGEFRGELEVRAKTGEEAKALFRIIVSTNWHDIKMERLS